MPTRPAMVPPGAPQGEPQGEAARPPKPRRYMVPVDGRPGCAGVIRETCRMAEAHGAPWLAAHLDASERFHYSRSEEERLSANLRLVEQLGGDTVQLQPAGDLARNLIALARARKVSHIVLGRPHGGRWLGRFSGSLLERLTLGDQELVIHVVPPQPGRREAVPLQREPEVLDWQKLGVAIGMVAVATGLGFLMFQYLNLADVMMVYMLCIAASATQLGRRETIIASMLSILALDFCFIQPRYTFVLTDIQHAGTFAVMFGVGWVILSLAERIRAQTRLAQERERHTRALYRVGAVLAEGGTVTAIQERVEGYLSQELEVPVVLLLCDGKGRLAEQRAGDGRLDDRELDVARTALSRGVPVGYGTERLPESDWLMLPMLGTERPIGVLALLSARSLGSRGAQRLGLLVPLASQISLALERAAVAEERTEARIRAEHEQLRSTLLSSISHDLRTPLGTITGATTTLLDPGPAAAPGDQKVLLNTIHHESRRLLRMVNNLLDITKLESGQVKVKREWVAIEEVVGSALSHLEDPLESRAVSVDLPEVWVPLDPVLFEQAMVNILDNALKFSPAGSPIEIRGWVEERRFHLVVADHGPGIPTDEEDLVFEKLYRGAGGASAPGAGLGLAICKGIVQAHGGTISARTGPMGGAQVSLELPLDGEALEGMPPELAPDLPF